MISAKSIFPPVPEATANLIQRQYPKYLAQRSKHFAIAKSNGPLQG
jgi:hypothetical protein